MSVSILSLEQKEKLKTIRYNLMLHLLGFFLLIAPVWSQSVNRNKGNHTKAIQSSYGWNALDQGLTNNIPNGYVYCLANNGTDIYAGGGFTMVGGGTPVSGLNSIAKWNGTSWSALGQGLNGDVTTIAVSSTGDVYAGGSFSDVGGGSSVAGLNGIAKWDGTSWSALGQGLNGAVNTIAISSTGDVYVGGQFSGVGGGSSVSGLNNIAKWNGTSWSALDQGLGSYRANAIVINGTDVYVGGEFSDVGGGSSVSGLNNIAKWNGTSWTALDQGLDQGVYSLKYSGGNLYATGAFSDVGGGSSVNGLNKIAKWDGTTWSALGQGFNTLLTSIDVVGSTIYVGGKEKIQSIADPTIAFGGVAQWNGISWVALDKGLNQDTFAVLGVGPDLYVGGFYTAVGTGGTPVTGVNSIARWGSAPLAISLVSFEAHNDQGNVTLEWDTASEFNNEGWEIEHKNTLGKWDVLGFVNGVGTSALSNHYRFASSNLVAGKHTFRLKQRDWDGTVTYSDPLDIMIEFAQPFSISSAYPNPFNPSTQWTFSVAQSQQIKIDVYNMLGQQVKTLIDQYVPASVPQSIYFDGATLASGHYIVVTSGTYFNTKFTVNLVK